MPCLALLLSLFRGSNSKSTNALIMRLQRYRNPQPGSGIRNDKVDRQGDGALPGGGSDFDKARFAATLWARMEVHQLRYFVAVADPPSSRKRGTTARRESRSG